MLNKVAQVTLSVFFVIGGVAYILYGGPEGQLLPLPETLAPLEYRLLLGSACIAAGVMGFIELRREIKNARNNGKS